MIVNALKSAASIWSGINYIKEATDSISRILITPDEIIEKEDIAQHCRTTLATAKDYLQKVEDHLKCLTSNTFE